jgi:hypothetical protein
MRVLKVAAPLCVAIALGGCAADEEWAHPTNGLKTTQADLAQCESAARNEAWRSGSAADSFTAARYAGTFDSRWYNEPVHRSTMNPQVQEIRMRDMCMESKGYQSVAVVNGEPQWGPDHQQYAGKQDNQPQLVGVQDDKPAPQ